MPSQTEIQTEITHRILDGLLFGVVPWRRPWRNDKNCGVPANVISRRPYSGINPLLLDMTGMSRGYTSKFWGTYQQWASLGAQVRKRPTDVEPGRWGTSIVFWKQVKKTKADENGKEKTETWPLLRYFTVFNIDQVHGESVDHLRPAKELNSSPLTADYGQAHQAITATRADIRYGGNQARYMRPFGDFPNHFGGDFIEMPKIGQFTSPHEFYATSFHELAHWSECRLDWTGTYGFGELIAEISASYLCAQLGIPCTDNLDNHTAYIKEWIKEFEDDCKAVLKAASQASKVADFILSFSRKSEPQPDELQTA